jgi:membrane protein DedA with SNARE-associated domain
MRLLTQRKTLEKLFFSEARLQTAESWFNKHGAPIVFLSRLVASELLCHFPRER